MIDENIRTKMNLTFLLAIIIVLAVFLMYFKFVYRNDINRGTAADFSGCGVLKESCIDKSCDLYYLCNDRDAASCKIYDCGEKYGVETRDRNGVVSGVYKDKFNKEKAEIDIVSCGGRLAVIEKKECDNNKAIAKVQLMIGKDCAINGFTMNVGGKVNMAAFSKENDYYVLSANNCGIISDITAIGEGGVQIKESY